MFVRLIKRVINLRCQLIYNPIQNLWDKLGKSSKTGQDKKNLRSTFARFLTATARVYFLEERMGTRLCLDPNLRFS